MAREPTYTLPIRSEPCVHHIRGEKGVTSRGTIVIGRNTYEGFDCEECNTSYRVLLSPPQKPHDEERALEGIEERFTEPGEIPKF